MATHSQNIENLRTAIYGEQVRTSMIQLFEEDYQLVKGGIGIGTDVSSASSPITGYVDGNLYINSDTLDIFKCNGSAWVNVGNLKGIADITTVPSTDDGGANVVTFTLTDGRTKIFNIKNGSKGSTGISVIDAIDKGSGIFSFLLSDGTETPSTITPIKGDKGTSVTDAIDNGDGTFRLRLSDGSQTPSSITPLKGDKGKDVTRISSTDSGKNHIITAEYSDGTSNIVTTIKDGADGSGTGDMSKADYDKDDNGIVDEAEALYDVATHTKIPASTVMNKADKSTTLGGYGITDAYTKAEVISRLNDKVSEPATDGKNGQALVTDGNGNRYWSDAGLSEEDKFTLSKIDSLTMSCQPWRATNYLAGEFVVKDGYIYEAKVNTKSTWDSTEWQLTNLRQINDKLSDIDKKITKPTTATDGQVLTYNGTDWVADDSQGGGSASASDIDYDNATSKLTSTDVQGAIDEVYHELISSSLNVAVSGDVTANSLTSEIKNGTVYINGQFRKNNGFFTDGEIIITLPSNLNIKTNKFICGLGHNTDGTPIGYVNIMVWANDKVIRVHPASSIMSQCKFVTFNIVFSI